MTTNKENLLLSVVFSPDGKRLILRSNDGISMFSSNGTQLKFNWEKKIEEVGPVIFSPDGKLVVCGGKKAGKEEEYSVNFFDFEGSLIGSIDVSYKNSCRENYFARATAIAFSQNGELFAIGNDKGGIGIYETKSWEVVDYELDDSHYDHSSIEKILFLEENLFVVKDAYLLIWKFANRKLKDVYDFYNNNSKLFHRVRVLDCIGSDVFVVTDDGVVLNINKSSKKEEYKYNVSVYGTLPNSVYSASFFRGNTFGLLAYCYISGFSSRDSIGSSTGLGVFCVDKKFNSLKPLYSLGFSYELTKNELCKQGKFTVMSKTSGGFIVLCGDESLAINSVAIGKLGGKIILAFTNDNKLEVVEIISHL